MLRSALSVAFAAAAIAVAAPQTLQAAAESPAVVGASIVRETGRREINGVDYYYEIHGEGEPLLLLHGGLGSIDMYAPILPMLTEEREVIAVALHGHGRAPLGDRTISMAESGADMALLVDALGYAQVDVLGCSFGGWTGLHLAADAPEKVRRLVLISMPYARDGFFPEMLPQQAQLSGASAAIMKDTPMYQSYMAVAPNPEEFLKLLEEMGRLMNSSYGYSTEVENLTMPVMLVLATAT